ncbi:hypothetical protein CEXT_171281 [Caerostris extrusa]|uniref:Uncharacterized protein n=1 Tax=Caerostris extrusa TaxID=172846 RepID=A0AAV4Y6W1_CAEEX|nr:hypothetical protein CEXT_171281 [Caerostris extrusa]
MEAELEHFAHTLFLHQYGDFEAHNIMYDTLNSEERLTLKGALKTIKKMDDIYGKIFDYYFKKLNNVNFLHSKRDFTEFVLLRCLDFCESPSFYNFLLVCLFMCRLLKSQPECHLLLQTAVKCLMILYYHRYADFFMANGGLTGMRKYFDEIEEEDLRSFIYRHANSDDEGILIPTFEHVFEIVTEFDVYYFINFNMGDTALEYLYDNCYPSEEIQTVGDNLKLPESPVTLDMEDEGNRKEYSLEERGISSEKTVSRVQMKCSCCGEKCFKYLMFRVLYRLRTVSKESIDKLNKTN